MMFVIENVNVSGNAIPILQIRTSDNLKWWQHFREPLQLHPLNHLPLKNMHNKNVNLVEIRLIGARRSKYST